jgi:steroid 5-alpha reductase family enzyme
MPAYVQLLASKRLGDVLSLSDWAVTISLISLVVFEFIADGQQWSKLHRIIQPRSSANPVPGYYDARTEYRKTAKVPKGFSREDLDRGFNTVGLFRWSRHPNFAAEQSIWVLVYQWSCLATDSFYNWTIAGAISYLILFQSSTVFTEAVSAGKYPEYKEYQDQVAMFVPTPLSLTSGPLKFSATQKKESAKSR